MWEETVVAAVAALVSFMVIATWQCYGGGGRELRDVKKKNLVVAGRVEVGMLGTVTGLL